MLEELKDHAIDLLKRAAQLLTGAKRRRFQAEVAQKYLGGTARRAETVFGWGREAVKTGLEELASGSVQPGELSRRGRRRTEHRLPQLAEDLRQLLDADSQVDPKFQTEFLYTRKTAENVQAELIRQGYSPDELPAQRTLRTILNRLGYRMRRVLKSKPAKKIPQTDAIFENVRRAHERSEQDDDCLRISIDTKAKVKIGEFSRRGKSRAKTAIQAEDHDMKVEAVLVPFGILEIEAAQLHVVFGTSRETSDFVADALQAWWEHRKPLYPQIRKLQIDLDNGPEISSNRTQFMDRVYETGVKLTKAQMIPVQQRLRRSGTLPRWCVTIDPKS